MKPLVFLAEMIKKFRLTLWDKGFVELPTPLIHKYDACPIFERVRLDDGRYLKESGGLALRCHLAYSPKVFEITTCARKDKISYEHLQQFTMLDLYQAELSLEEAVNLCLDLVTSFYKGPIETCSVANLIKNKLGIDLIYDPDSEVKLKNTLRKLYESPDSTLYSLVNRFMMLEVEPLSKDILLIVTDIPRAAESAGRQTPGTVGIARIAEFQINGMEVAQLIEDESDTELYVKKAEAHGHYGPEVDIVVKHIKEQKIPSRSAGFGIGLERLAMAVTGVDHIREFMPLKDFIHEL